MEGTEKDRVAFSRIPVGSLGIIQNCHPAPPNWGGSTLNGLAEVLQSRSRFPSWKIPERDSRRAWWRRGWEPRPGDPWSVSCLCHRDIHLQGGLKPRRPQRCEQIPSTPTPGLRTSPLGTTCRGNKAQRSSAWTRVDPESPTGRTLGTDTHGGTPAVWRRAGVRGARVQPRGAEDRHQPLELQDAGRILP